MRPFVIAAECWLDACPGNIGLLDKVRAESKSGGVDSRDGVDCLEDAEPVDESEGWFENCCTRRTDGGRSIRRIQSDQARITSSRVSDIRKYHRTRVDIL